MGEQQGKQIGKQIGTEHEYSINDSDWNPLPISDRIIERISGAVEHEVTFGGIKVSKELQKHALELIPARPGSLTFLEDNLYRGLTELYRATNYEYKFLGLGMHPLLTLDQTTYWDHDEQEYYQTYDRLFNIRQHGWLNIQALQINIPFISMEEMVVVFNKIRSLIPYLVAVSASSPIVEGRPTNYMDNRLVYYRENQRCIPSICNDILPERLASAGDYVKINREIYRELKSCGADILCREWVNSRGLIVRFTRRCVEVKAIDEQECLHSDMAVTAFLLALLRSDLVLEEEESSLRALLEEAMKRGVAGLRPELEKLYGIALKNATVEERSYLPVVAKRIEQGSLAELMAQKFKETGEIKPLLDEME
ncbi:MAG TPA: glutamate-cysteine ligase family protein, partial [Methanotrichaceae archaeon]|nr:glutamate-cysteine ligase family protein [Methanotrichaceae archaeon]